MREFSDGDKYEKRNV